MDLFFGGKLFGHTGKEDPVEGKDGLPIGPSPKAAGPKRGRLDKWLVVDLKLKPRFFQHFYFGSEDEEGGGAVGFAFFEVARAPMEWMRLV